MVHTLRVSARDKVTDMFCKRMAIIHRKGRERLEELREAHRAESERLLEVFGDVLAAARQATAAEEGSAGGDTDAGAVSDAAGGQAVALAGALVLQAIESGGGLEQLSAAHEAVAAYHGNNYLPLPERFYRSHRPVLFTLVDALDLQATPAERAVLDAVEFIRANRDRRGEWIEESTVHLRDGEPATVAVDIGSFASEQWRKALRDKRRPGLLARRHLEVCVLSHLAAELRSGDIAVAGSDSYANLHDQLMSWEECQPHVAGFCEQAGIPASTGDLVAHFRARLEKTASAVDAGYPANADLRLEGGRPVLARRKGADRRPSALTLEARILDRLPERGLLDILARTAHLTGWHRHFGPPSGSDPKIADTMGRYVVTAFAYGGHWPDLLRTGISIREGRLSSVTLLRRLGNHSRRNRLYRALRELGRVVRTVTLLRYLSEPALRDHITAVTNRTESFHNYATWLMIGGRLIGHNDPDYQEKVVKLNELVANAAIYPTALDITDAANALAAEGHPVDPDDLATITPYITRTIRRFGDWVLDLKPPDGLSFSHLVMPSSAALRTTPSARVPVGRRTCARERYERQHPLAASPARSWWLGDAANALTRLLAVPVAESAIWPSDVNVGDFVEYGKGGEQLGLCWRSADEVAPRRRLWREERRVPVKLRPGIKFRASGGSRLLEYRS
jgi:hypothetical protein